MIAARTEVGHIEFHSRPSEAILHLKILRVRARMMRMMSKEKDSITEVIDIGNENAIVDIPESIITAFGTIECRKAKMRFEEMSVSNGRQIERSSYDIRFHGKSVMRAGKKVGPTIVRSSDMLDSVRDVLDLDGPSFETA